MPLKTVIALMVVATGVLSSSAFDWKAKPTAQLKADLVA